jgi:hypothetical protein
MQNVNVLPNIYGHIFEIPLHIAWNSFLIFN